MKRLLVVLFGLLGLLDLSGSSAHGQVVTPDESTVVVASPKKVGINLNYPRFYGAAELYKNLMWRNPGFEPDLYRDKFAAYADGSTTTFPSPNQYDPVVANFWAGATFRLYRGNPKAQVCSGVIAGNTATTGAAGPVYTFVSACPTAVVQGDILVLRKLIACTPEADWEGSHAGWWASVSGGGKITSDCANPYDGVQSMVIDASVSGATAQAIAHIDTAPWVTGILLNGQYTISGYYKTGGQGSLTIAAKRNQSSTTGNPFSCATQTFPSSPQWTSFTMNCTGAETSALTAGNDVTVTFTAQGGTAEIDDVSFVRTDNQDPNNFTMFRDEVLATLKAHCTGAVLSAVPCELRDWAGQNAEEIDNTIKPIFQRALQVNSFNYDYAGGQGFPSESVGLDEFLKLCAAIGAEPYYALPETTAPEDAAAWIEYLNGDASTKYGAIRKANGMTASWLSVFPTIHLAMGNENWNESQSGEGLGYRAGAPDFYYDYSTDAAAVFGAMRTSPSWTSTGVTGATAFDLVLGLQNGNPDYGVQEAMTRTGATSGELAPYTQFYVGDTSPLTSLWNPLMYEVVANTTNTAATFYQQGKAVQRTAKLNVYEFDNGTTQGSTLLTQNTLDSFSDAAGYGTATALQALQHLSFGIVDQNFFSLSEFYSSGPNGLKVHNWGAVMDMGGATNAVRPQELGLRMVNAAIIGAMYACPITNPTTYNLGTNHNGMSSNGTPTANGIPQEYAFCFKDTMYSRSMIVINVDVTNSHKVTFAGAGAPEGSVTVTRYAPSSISARNESASTAATNAATQTVTISAPVTVMNPASDTLPPYSITRYDWTSTGGTTSSTPPATSTPPGTSTPVGGGGGTPTAPVVTPMVVSLSGKYNVYAIDTAGRFPQHGGADSWSGATYNSASLGTTVNYAGLKFTLGAANTADAFYGGPLMLPAGAFSHIAFLGTGMDQAWTNQSIVVTYTDGTSDTFMQSFSNWNVQGGYAGETVAATAASSLSKYGAVVNGKVYIYGYTLALPAGKTAATLKFPMNSGVVIFGVQMY